MVDLEHRQTMRTISGLLIGTLVATLSSNILATALPRILPALHVSVSGYTWVSAVYALMLSISVPVWGKLADLTDKKRLLEIVFCLYMSGSIVAGCATSGWMLVVGRGIQGLGTGGLAGVSSVVLAVIIAPRRRGRYNGYSGIMFAVGTVSGPLVGGALVGLPILGWRACFIAPLPFGVAALVMIHRYLRIPANAPRKVVIDLRGLTALIASAGALVTLLSIGGVSFAWLSWASAGFVTVAAVGGVLFVLVERRAPEPLVRINMFRSRPVALAAGASFVCGAISFSVPLFLAQLFQLGWGDTAIASGLQTIPLIAGIFTASWVVGRLITATGRIRPFLVLGGITQSVGVGTLAWVAGGSIHHPVLMSFCMYILGIGYGILQQNVTLFVQNFIPRRDLGSGTAAVQFARFLGGAVGVSALGALSAARLASHLKVGYRSLPASLIPPDTGTVPKLASLSTAARHVVETAYAQSFRDLFLVLLPCCLIAAVAVFLLRDIHLSDQLAPVETPEATVAVAASAENLA